MDESIPGEMVALKCSTSPLWSHCDFEHCHMTCYEFGEEKM